MALQIPNHSHCAICSKAVPFGDKTCGKDCQAKYDDLQKRRRRTQLMMYGLMALAFVVLLLSLTNPSLFGA